MSSGTGNFGPIAVRRNPTPRCGLQSSWGLPPLREASNQVALLNHGVILIATMRDSFYSIECFKVFGRAPVEGEGCKISKVKDLNPNESIWPIFDLIEQPNTTSSPIHCEPMSKNPFCWEN